MDLITHRLGSVRTLTIIPEDDNGAPVPAAVVELRVATPTACVILPGVSNGAGEIVVTLTDVDLPPRMYQVSLYIDGRHEGDFGLNIEEGC